MRVNSVNVAGMRNIAFGKVIKIKTEEALHNVYDPEIDPKTRSIVDVIEGKNPPEFASYKKSICDYLRSKIGDYNKENGLVAEKVCGDVFVFTGKEAVAARKITEKVSKGTACRTWTQTQMTKDIELLGIVGKAKYTGAYDEIDADFGDDGKFKTLTYKNVISTK